MKRIITYIIFFVFILTATFAFGMDVKPAFAVPSCGLDKTELFPGDSLAVTSYDSLEGDIRMAPTGTTTSSISLGYLPPNDFNLVTIPGTTTAGTYTIRVGLYAVTCGDITVKSNTGTYTVAWRPQGCTDLTCTQTSATLTTKNYTITVPTTGATYEVFVCTPNCGTGTALTGWNPKICISGAGGEIYADWTSNYCGSKYNTKTGTVECSGFANCVTSFAAPSGYSSDGFIGTLISRFLPIAIAFGGFLTVIFIVISGIQFITSSGNPDAAAAARGRLTFAIIGFILLVLAFMLTKLVDKVLLRGSGIFQ